MAINQNYNKSSLATGGYFNGQTKTIKNLNLQGKSIALESEHGRSEKDACMQILIDFAPNILKSLRRDAPGYRVLAHEIEAVRRHYLHYKFFKKYDSGISQLEGQIHTLKLYSMDDLNLERAVVADYTGSGIRI